MSVDTKPNSNAQTIEQRDSISGNPVSIGNGFDALSFDYRRYDSDMDPLLLVDHFVMTEATFGPHAHAGMSAVSILFEDSQGVFNNKDSLGHDIDLMPGDLYWLKAARGAVHDEKPLSGSNIHALQVFVNLPARMKYDPPGSLHVLASNMPVLFGQGFRARLVLGESGGIQGQKSPAQSMTIIDVSLEKDGRFSHYVPAGETVFALSIEGSAKVEFGQQAASLPSKTSTTFRPLEIRQEFVVTAKEPAQLVIIQAKPIREKFVMNGPFAMSTQAENDDLIAAYAAGKLGRIKP